ncbi:MAG: hypothetical protein MPW15_16225 [Candidatus Manganitrophus sp.]|nr:hypothetical protein [Candidatus Manganitrophus sp.]
MASARCAEAFLRADGDDGLAVGIQVHVVAALVPGADGPAQARDALRDRIAVRVAAARGLDELVDDVLRRRLVRVAHAEIDHVLAALTGLRLQLVDDVEHIRRQPLDSLKFHSTLFANKLRNQTD